MNNQSVPLYSERLPLGAVEIQKIIPHRYPFLYIDKVTEFEDSERIVGIKCVSANEPYFQGHFPGNPIMPGVVILEAMAQLGVLFAKMSTKGVGPDKLMVFAGAESVRFRKPVVPGDCMRIEIVGHRRRGPIWKIEAVATVEGQVVCEASITAAET